MEYFNVFKDKGFHSALMTTYAFSAHTFEDVILSKLRASGCQNIGVLVDKHMFQQSIRNFGIPQYAGYLYRLSQVSMSENSNFKGNSAFHPKITLLLGEKSGKLYIGSANLTESGIAGNWEIITKLEYSHDNLRFASIFRQVFNYFRKNIPNEDEFFSECIEFARNLSPWILENNTETGHNQISETSILSNSNESTILDQIRSSIGQDKISRLFILSPYWDSSLNGLHELRKQLEFPETEILIDPKSEKFPIRIFQQKNFDDVYIYDLSKILATKSDVPYRFFHAKLIIACGEMYDHVISGSINCSVNALLNHNAEMGIYSRVNKGFALKALDLEKYQAAPLEFSNVSEYNTEVDETQSSDHIDVGTFVLEGNKLKWSGIITLSNLGSVCMQTFSINLEDNGDLIPDKKTDLISVGPQTFIIEDPKIRPRVVKLEFLDKLKTIETFVTDLDLLIKNLLHKKGSTYRKYKKLFDETDEEYQILLQNFELSKLIDDIENQHNKRQAGQRLNTVNSVLQAEEDTFDEEISTVDYIEARQRLDAKSGSTRQFANFSGFHSVNPLISLLNKLIGYSTNFDKYIEKADNELKSRAKFSNYRTIEEEEEQNEGVMIHTQSEETDKSIMTKLDKGAVKKVISKLDSAEKNFKAKKENINENTDVTSLFRRFRTLLQITLAISKPLDINSKEFQVLEIFGDTKKEWPRRIGKLLNLNHSDMKTFYIRSTSLNEENSGSYSEINISFMEYLAFAYYSIYAANIAIRSIKTVPPSFVKMLFEVKNKLDADMKQIFKQKLGIEHEFTDFFNKINERFKATLNLPSVTLTARDCPMCERPLISCEINPPIPGLLDHLFQQESVNFDDQH